MSRPPGPQRARARRPSRPAGARSSVLGAALASFTAFFLAGCPGEAPDDDDDASVADVVVSIQSPSAGARFFTGAPILFQGAATDDAGAVPGERLSWSSSLDGALGAGAELTRDDLSAGAHTITLTATRAGGVEGLASVSIAVVAAGDNLPPVPTITAPLEGAQVVEDASLTLSGQAVDPEDGALADGALLWTSDVDGLLGSGAGLTVSGLSRGPHVITLTAVDSLGASAMAAVGMEVFAAGENLPPVATLLEPSNGALLTWGAASAFSASGLDREDGALSDTQLAWRSDLDGALGTGQSLSVSTLSLGVHEITLTATDSAGLTDEASILVNVNPASTRPPAVRILEPAGGAAFAEGDPVTLVGEAIDTQEGALSGPALVWSSSIDGELGSGDRRVVDSLSPGLHTIRLTATDDSGAVATASIQVRAY